ncbi:Nif3-like dinuclear metal center hexameric protein [Idiomarina seosinensis]|uniref:GTP cyclohydrolase 1 type 2 homolog n=1 Tax=Idiomarina seosinensis TaxID=281739 RepID=A0A432ZIB7_9GAMM|nr:Nif3-like dinuclear metal center hexameric protein [Idiomarina seosinensis]RUO77653.1 Nif3-like dinuclear metal center hexameric protein [Idiomarina seosinensis]
MAIARSELVDYLNKQLNVSAIRDFCPNGLQVEGADTIQRVITGVTASQALLDKAAEKGVDTVLVHHGYFWKNEPANIVGMKQRRIKTLLQNNINLLAYHLPLDVHPIWGNNAQLANLMGWRIQGPADSNDAGCALVIGDCDETNSDDLAAQLEHKLERPLTCYVSANRAIKKLSWCTGGGQGFIDQAAALGVDAFITGEVSEQTVHSAREQGMAFYAAGHHATERYGAKALGEHLQQQFQLDVEFIDIDNPA